MVYKIWILVITTVGLTDYSIAREYGKLWPNMKLQKIRNSAKIQEMLILGQSFSNYGPGYRRPLGTIPNIFDRPKNHLGQHFNKHFGSSQNHHNLNRYIILLKNENRCRVYSYESSISSFWFSAFQEIWSQHNSANKIIFKVIQLLTKNMKQWSTMTQNIKGNQ